MDSAYNANMDEPDETAVPRAMPAGRVFHFRCLRCGSVLEGRSRQCGRRGKCPTCGAVFTVPEIDPRTGLAMSHADPGDDGENPTPLHAYAAAGAKAPRIVRKEDDSLAIECPRCNRQSAISASNCQSCGLPFTLEGASRAVTTAVHSVEGTAALVVGLVSLPLVCVGVGWLPGLVAIALGLHARLKSGYDKDGPAIAGIVLGALACLVSVLTLLGLLL